MRKGELTRDNIIAQAARIFNSNGFAGASLSQLMEYTGLKKGGIYNHFKNKEEIVVEAFDYAVRQVRKAIYKRIMPLTSARDKLLGIIDFYNSYPLNPVIPGGCPLVNTTIDADNVHPLLQERVRREWERLISNLAELIDMGKNEGSFVDQADSREWAQFIISSIQGGIILTRNFANPSMMQSVTDRLKKMIHLELEQSQKKG